MSEEIQKTEEKAVEVRANVLDLGFIAKEFDAINQLAELMSNGQCTLPVHLQKKAPDCFAIILQAQQWRMNPFAVAQKTHIVQGKLGYESQLVVAAINSVGPLDDRLEYEWFGEWDKILGNFKILKSAKGHSYQAPAWNAQDEEGLGVFVRGTIKGRKEELRLLLKQATVRNSTLWASDPRQQLAYLAAKRWARLYCPEVILGAYSPDELAETPGVVNVTALGRDTTIPPPDEPAVAAPMQAPKAAPKAEEKPVPEPAPADSPEPRSEAPSKDNPGLVTMADRNTAIREVILPAGVTMKELNSHLQGCGAIPKDKQLMEDLSATTAFLANAPAILEEVRKEVEDKA